MARRVFRVCRSTYARLDGEGARRVGGRWNSPGHRAVYMAESIALAVLENLVHMSREDFPRGYVTVAASFPDDLPLLTESNLRGRYGNLPDVEVGDRWIQDRASAILKVPSIVVPQEFNFLLNPEHPDFRRVLVELPVPFTFDDRLFQRGGSNF